MSYPYPYLQKNFFGAKLIRKSFIETIKAIFELF